MLNSTPLNGGSQPSIYVYILPGDPLLHLLPVGDIDQQSEALPLQLPYLLRDALVVLLHLIHRHDFGAGLGQRQRDAPPMPLPAPVTMAILSFSLYSSSTIPPCTCDSCISYPL